jgi:hypothetical protein
LQFEGFMRRSRFVFNVASSTILKGLSLSLDQKVREGSENIKKLILHDHLLLDSAPNIGRLRSCSELDKFKNC